MSDRLKSMITLHETIVGGKLPSLHVKSCIEGLQVVQYNLQTTLRKDIIVESFKITGQYDPVTARFPQIGSSDRGNSFGVFTSNDG